MHSLPEEPAAAGQRQTTGLGCPDCPGVLSLEGERQHPRFRCRIGHAFSLVELIEAKERRIEEALWAPITTLDELATLLEELVEIEIGPRAACAARAARARQQIAALRQIIEANDPVVLDGHGTSDVIEP